MKKPNGGKIGKQTMQVEREPYRERQENRKEQDDSARIHRIHRQNKAGKYAR